jgi:hypothetical protein
VILSALICSTVGAGPLVFVPDAFFSFCCFDAVILLDLEDNHHEVYRFLIPSNQKPGDFKQTKQTPQRLSHVFGDGDFLK